ncbi:Uncharacterised protein [Yersinia aldovae]|uniref:hypothetical protein n=1 Tax=Yersinia aldovae TaxID=29483 RepID=UPI0005E56B19|nr:hypothetical protein [Yersinia aldovae]CNH81763.1 Uncharacterised protein [Yersinia aldovae]
MPSTLRISVLIGIAGWIHPSYFKLHVRWLLSFTRITYLSKLIGTHSVAAFPQLELFRVQACNAS